MGCCLSSEKIVHHDSTTSKSVINPLSQDGQYHELSNSAGTLNEPGGSEPGSETQYGVTTHKASKKYELGTKVDNDKMIISMPSDEVESVHVATQKTSPTRSTESMPQQYNTPNKSDSILTTTKQLSGGDAHAGLHKSKKKKHNDPSQHQNDTKSKSAYKSKQRYGKSKQTIRELDKRGLIEIYNRARRVIDERSDELHASKQHIRQLEADRERVAALCIKSRDDLENFKDQVQNEQKESMAREHNLQSSIKALTKQNEDLKNTIEKYRSSKQALEQLTTKYEHTVDRLNRDAAKLQQEIHELKQANDDLKNRLSAVFGAKLQDNNPDIADLGDPNRPMKLAERFSELYDNEWTNCFEVLTKQTNIDEKEAIGQMLQACLTIYQDCSTNASNDLKTLTQALDRFDGETDIRLVKDLKEKRKRRFQQDIKRLRQPIEDKIFAIFKEKTNEKNVAEFWSKCIELCWLMVIQDPPVSMDTRPSQLGDIFDGAIYRHYTKSGKYVEFIVWPALRLTETGSLLYKGVAQGTDTYQEYSDRVDYDVNTEKQTSSKTSTEYQNENESCAVDETKRSDNISKIGMGDTVLENTKGQNNSTIPKHTDKRTDRVVCFRGESEMSQNQHIANAERAVPTQETNNSNTLHKNHTFDADGNQPVNVDSLYKNTQPNKRHAEDLSDEPNHNTSKLTEKTGIEQSKQDGTQPNMKPITTSTSVAQNGNDNSTQQHGSRRKSNTGENNQMSGTKHKQEKEYDQSLKSTNAPKQNMTQTVSPNARRGQKAQSVKLTANSATSVMHKTSISVGSLRLRNIPR